MKPVTTKKKKKTPVRRRLVAKANRATRGAVARTHRKGKRIGTQWLRLLADPCNAPLVNAPYEGTDSGYLMRTHGSLTLPTPSISSGLTDFAVQFYPGKPQNSTTSWNLGSYMVSATGTPLHDLGDFPLPGFIQPAPSVIGAVGQFRPIAACIKFSYTGTTLNQQGIIGRALTNTQILSEAGLTSPGITASELMVFTNDVQRTPLSKNGEIRWLPQECDGIFSQWSAVAVPPASSIYCGNACTLIGVSIPDATIYLDWTVCWEWTPAAYSGAGTATFSGLTPIMKSPSPVPFNTVVSQIPSPSSFAVAPLDRIERWLGVAGSALGVGQGIRSLYNSAMEGFMENGLEELAIV